MDKHILPFETELVEGDVPPDARLAELIRWGRLFHELGLAPSYGTGSHGNLSIRSGGGCLITATQTFLGELAEEHFMEIVGCDLEARPPRVKARGKRRPSTDSMIHWSLYQWRPETACVLHAHDPATLAWGGELGFPQTAKPADAGSPDLVALIRPLAKEPYFLVRGHGFVAQGRTIQEAGELALAAHRKAAAFQQKKV